MNRLFTKASEQDFAELYQWYIGNLNEPFFVDISGPSPLLSYADFVNECTEDAELKVLRNEGGLSGFVLLYDIQPRIGVANLEFRIFPYHVRWPEGVKKVFGFEIQNFFERRSVTRLQSMCLPLERERIELLVQSGFQLEGRLRKHFFSNGIRQDLMVMGRAWREQIQQAFLPTYE